ncbi:hypothetical protein DV701_12945 [Ornithinimicrobium avium]|uniref:Uncharacterized protein n=1 Tax=Ornithinimicrobium avium TaxID=2283195 RepID=A0A345NPE5_9MICO|nr:hypothetical protein DV701_12945 [Ornithinimicrobium avium]
MLVTALVVGPSLRALAVVVAVPGLGEVLAREDLPALVAAAAGLLVWGALAVGTTHGPVMGSPLRIHVLAGGPQPRRMSLRGSFVRRLLVLVVAGAALGAVPGLALLHLGAGGAGTTALGGAMTGACVGGVTAAGWLAGQALSRRGVRRAALLVPVCAGLVATLLLVGPAALPPGWTSPVTVLLLLVLLVAGLTVVPGLLDRLRGPVLLEQATRWQGATTAGGAGDLAGAAATYRPVPSRHGRWDAVGRGGSLPLLFLRRDLVGAARTPVRLLVGISVLLLALVLGIVVSTLSSGPSWAVLAVAFAMVHVRLGVVSDGFRHAVEASAAPTLYGVPDHHLVGLHAALPLAVVLVLGAAAALVAVPLTGVHPVGALLVVVGGLFCVAVRAYDAARGPMPLLLLTPVPTAAGDMSGLMVAAWQADALLVAVLVPTLVTVAAVSLGGWLVLIYAPAAALVLLGLRRRMSLR